MLSMYDVEGAIGEMQRARNAGLRGAVIWQTPAPELPFTSDHYDPFWAAAAEADMPVNLHILSGHGYSRDRALGPPPAPASEGRPPEREGRPEGTRGIESERRSVNRKLSQAIDTLYDLIFSGVLDRFPRLKVVLVENEIGWMPFVLEQWDYYFKRHGTQGRSVPLRRLPSEYFHDQVSATFFNDAVGARLLSWWGADNCMWSNDYPHGNSTWPHSGEIVARDLGSLPAETRTKVLRENVARLYGLTVPEPIEASSSH